MYFIPGNTSYPGTYKPLSQVCASIDSLIHYLKKKIVQFKRKYVLSLVCTNRVRLELLFIVIIHLAQHAQIIYLNEISTGIECKRSGGDAKRIKPNK